MARRRRRRPRDENEAEHASWDAPRRFNKKDEGERLPVREPDGQWKRVFTSKKKKQQQQEEEPPADDEASTEKGVSKQELEEVADEVETEEEKRMRIAQIGTIIVENPHERINSLSELFYLVKRDSSWMVQMLALLSIVQVIRDLIPAYRIRPPTEVELQTKVSRPVELLREYESRLLHHYTECLEHLKAWSSSDDGSTRRAAIRGLCALLEKGYDFNHRDELIAIVVPFSSSDDDADRGAVCTCLKSLFVADKTGDATLQAVKQMAHLLKFRGFSTRPELLDTWLHLRLDAAVPGGKTPLSKKQKRRKQALNPLMKELANAEGEHGNRAHAHSQTVEHVFASYARVVKRGTTSTLLPSVLRGIAKFAHQVNVDLLLDIFSNLRTLLATEGALSTRSALMCVHALLRLLSGHGSALNVDTKDVHLRLYRLLANRALLAEPRMLATALDCVEHLATHSRASLLAPRAASFTLRLLGLACGSPPSHAIALLCAASRLQVACPRISTMFAAPEGGPRLMSLYGGAGAVDAEVDMDSPLALSSTAWQLAGLRSHFHPTVAELATKLAAGEAFPPKFLSSTPLKLMTLYSDEQGGFNPPPRPPKAHKLAGQLASAKGKGGGGPTLGAVPTCALEAVREAVADAEHATVFADGAHFSQMGGLDADESGDDGMEWSEPEAERPAIPTSNSKNKKRKKALL